MRLFLPPWKTKDGETGENVEISPGASQSFVVSKNSQNEEEANLYAKIENNLREREFNIKDVEDREGESRLYSAPASDATRVWFLSSKKWRFRNLSGQRERILS
jgi:hypothetical protein